MADKIEFYQIYYEQNQFPEIFPFAIPYFNIILTPFFENSIISDLVMKAETDKIGVCSWALRQKMTMRIPPREDLTEEALHGDFDVLSFSKNAPDHDMIGALNTWHGGCSDILRLIFQKLGFSMPKKPKYPIYQNAFCARTEIYQSYVKDFLHPAMDLMIFDNEIRNLCWRDSNYTRTILNVKINMERVKEFLGSDYVPLHPFLLERCFSLWIDDKNLNVKYL